MSGSKLFDTLIVFLKEFFEKVDFEKSQQTTKKNSEKLPSIQKIHMLYIIVIWFPRQTSISSGSLGVKM